MNTVRTTLPMTLVIARAMARVVRAARAVLAATGSDDDPPNSWPPMMSGRWLW